MKVAPSSGGRGGKTKTNDMAFEAEKLFYNRHREEWLPQHQAKFAVIQGEKLVGTFATIEDAHEQALRRLRDEHFLIVRLNPDRASDPRCLAGQLPG